MRTGSAEFSLVLVLLVTPILTSFSPPIAEQCSGFQTGQIMPILSSSPTTSVAVTLSAAYPTSSYFKWFGLIGLGYQDLIPSFNVSIPSNSSGGFTFAVTVYQNSSSTYQWSLKFQYLTADSQYSSWVADESSLLRYNSSMGV